MFDYQTDAVLDMAFGAPEEMHMPLPSIKKQEGNFGVSRFTVRRARALVADSAHCIQEKKLERAVELDKDFTVRCVKLGWDETEVRMMCSLERAQHLFPLLRYCTDDDASLRKRPMKRPRPCFRMQCMQQVCCVKVAKIEGNFQVSPMMTKSTAAPDLYDAATGFSVLDVVKRGLDSGQAGAEPKGVVLMSCHMDSLEANKNVFTKSATDNENVLHHDGICEGQLRHV